MTTGKTLTAADLNAYQEEVAELLVGLDSALAKQTRDQAAAVLVCEAIFDDEGVGPEQWGAPPDVLKAWERMVFRARALPALEKAAAARMAQTRKAHPAAVELAQSVTASNARLAETALAEFETNTEPLPDGTRDEFLGAVEAALACHVTILPVGGSS